MRIKWRAKWLASCAAILAAVVTLVSCENKNVVGIDLTNLTIIGTSTDTVGKCVIMTDMYVEGVAPGGNLNISVNEIRDLRVVQRFNPKKCGKHMSFNWESHDENVVRATRLDRTRGRIIGVSPGATLVCASAVENANIVVCVVVTVGGGGNVPNTVVTLSPSGQTVSTCSSSPRTLQLTATTANPSGLSGVWTVSGISGASVSQDGLLTLPENSFGTVVVTFTASNGAVGLVTVLASNFGCNPTPSPIITIAPSSLCFSMQLGQPASLPVTVTATNANLADVRLVSSLTGVTLTGSGANWNVVRSGSFTDRADGNISAHLVGDPNTPLASIPVQVYTTLCPGQSGSISYTPSGGTVSGTETLTATCIQGSGQTACNPYWTSSDPSRLRVEGTGSVNVGGVTYRVGTTATLTAVASGSAEICVQWSLTQTSPRFCSVKTVP
ncbi:MAG: hypothetical protein ACYCY6_00115 [Minisyncoccota bacterium]